MYYEVWTQSTENMSKEIESLTQFKFDWSSIQDQLPVDFRTICSTATIF